MTSLAESRLRLLGLAEGVSFILGSLHGGLFVLYVVPVVLIALAQEWRLMRVILALAVPVIPFGPFLFDRHLQREAALQAQKRRNAI